MRAHCRIDKLQCAFFVVIIWCMRLRDRRASDRARCRVRYHKYGFYINVVKELVPHEKLGQDPFYGQIKKLVIPIVVQNLLSATVNSADVVMLNFVGQSAISAVSWRPSTPVFCLWCFYGLGTGATMLCAQYYGRGGYAGHQCGGGIALRFSMLISTVLGAAVPLYSRADDENTHKRCGAHHPWALRICEF